MAKFNAPRKSRRAAGPKEMPGAAVEPEASAEASEATPVLIAEAEAPASPTPRRPIDLVADVKRHLKTFTDYPVDSVSGFGKADDGWRLTVTVVELNRIPPATDVLADYEVSLDAAGDIVNYRRGRRYFRDQVGGPE